MENKKRSIVFNDAENQKITIDISLKEGRFSMSGSCGGSFGQMYDSIKPTTTQKKLIDIWKKYHLNDMNAGTPEQEEALKNFKGDYPEKCEHLKKAGLYEVDLKGKKYKYGTAWLTRDLPVNLWVDVEAICDKIEKEQEAYKKEREGGSWDDLDDKIKALGQFLEMSPKEAEENISESSYNSNLLEAEGIDYYVGDEDEIRAECESHLKDDESIYLSWVEHEVKNGNASGIMNIDDWADWVINSDGYGHILNGYDGSEEYNNELKLYIIRQ
jgi:hypothetical protein